MPASKKQERFDLLEEALIAEALAREWNIKYAKFAGDGSQSLFVHALNTAYVARVLGEHVFGLDEDDLLLAYLSAFLHDYQKASDSWQSAAVAFIEGKRPDGADFSHGDGSEKAREHLREILTSIQERAIASGLALDVTGLLDRILNIIVYTHDTKNPAEAVRRKSQVGPLDPVTRVIRLADAISSIRQPSDILKKIADLDMPEATDVSFDYHEIAVVRGIVTSFLNEAIIDSMEEMGYKPLLHFGNGTVYLNTGSHESNGDFAKVIEDKLDSRAKAFQESDVYQMGKTNAVIGPYNQTKWPAIQLVREQDIPEIIGYLSSLPAMNQSEKDGREVARKAKSKEKKEALDDFLKKTGSEPNTILAMMTSDFYLFVYIADFLKNYATFASQVDRYDEFIQDVNQLISDEFPGLTLDSLSDISHTTRFARRLEAISSIWSLEDANLHREPSRRRKLVKAFERILRGVLSRYSNCAPKLFTNHIKKLLISDIRYLPLSTLQDTEIRRLSKGPTDRYLSGKDQKDRICSFCGAEGVSDAPATLFGDGPQRFSNFLKAGTTIGTGKKAQVCEVCMVESMLRAFYFPSAPATTMVVIPDLSLSPAMARQWANAVKDFTRRERVGLSTSSTWNMLDIYKKLAGEETINNAAQLARLLRPTNTRVNRLVAHLKNVRSSPDEVVFEGELESAENLTFERIAKAHLSGNIKIHERLLEGYREPSRIQGTAYLTSGHMFLFFRNPLYEDKDESPSTIAIRAHLLALIIAKVYHARVIVIDGFQTITDLSMDGVVRSTLPAPAATALASLGVSEEPRLHETMSSLTKLAALTLTAMSYVKKMGKDRLLRMASMNRGAILRRAQMENSQQMKKYRRQFIELLDVLPAVAGEDEFTSNQR
jgi:hypothetical protein